MSDQELEFLATAARNASNLLEVGCHKGRSTRALADNTNGMIYCVDPWKGIYYSDDYTRPIFESGNWTLSEFCHNLIDKNNIKICRGYLRDYIKHLPEMDFVFIDGDHHYAAVVEDIRLSMQLLRPGAMIAGHDYAMRDWPGVKQAVDSELGRVSICDTIWWKVMK